MPAPESTLMLVPNVFALVEQHAKRFGPGASRRRRGRHPFERSSLLLFEFSFFLFFSKSFLPFTFADEVKVVNISRLLWPEAIRRGISKSKQRRARRIVFVVAVRYIFYLLQKRFANNKEKINYFERHFLFCFQWVHKVSLFTLFVCNTFIKNPMNWWVGGTVVVSSQRRRLERRQLPRAKAKNIPRLYTPNPCVCAMMTESKPKKCHRQYTSFPSFFFVRSFVHLCPLQPDFQIPKRSKSFCIVLSLFSSKEIQGRLDI